MSGRIFDCLTGKQRCDDCIQMDMIDELRRVDTISQARIRVLEGEKSRLLQAAQGLTAKIRECEPFIFPVMALHQIRTGTIYVGPNYADELSEMEKQVRDQRVH